VPTHLDGGPDLNRARRDPGVPDDVQFASKTDLARLMLGRALDPRVPASRVTADEAYGKDGSFRDWLEQRRIGYVAAVPKSQAVAGDAGKSRADVLTAHAPDQAWKRRSCGNGSKRPRVFDWAAALALPAPGLGDHHVAPGPQPPGAAEVRLPLVAGDDVGLVADDRLHERVLVGKAVVHLRPAHTRRLNVIESGTRHAPLVDQPRSAASTIRARVRSPWR